MLRVAFLGSDGQLSYRSLRTIAERHRVVAVVTARPRVRSPVLALRRSLGALARRVGLGRSSPVATFARAGGIPHWQATRGRHPETGLRLAEIRPDVICIAGYPWLLPADIFGLPPLGAINLHGSLLPRHRGMLPLFWIYYHDDRDTGVTVHRVTDRVDAGAILDQEAFPLPRGLNVERLNLLNTDRGAGLLERTLDALACGAAREHAQDESRATPAPWVTPGQPMVNFHEWEVERVWHFLSGLYPYFREPLRTTAGRPVRYRAVSGYTSIRHSQAPGTVERVAGGYTLFCRGGKVELC